MKSKFFAFIIGLVFITSGCSWLFYNRVQEFDDEFKNSKKMIVRMLIKPQESKTEIKYAIITFEREVSDKDETVKAYFVISRSSSSFKTEPTGYLKIDNDTYKITLNNILSEHKSETETSVSTYVNTDSTSVSSGSTTDSDTYIWIDDKFMFSFTPDMISKIKMADAATIRFDFGPIPGTFKIKGADFNRLKRILHD